MSTGQERASHKNCALVTNSDQGIPAPPELVPVSTFSRSRIITPTPAILSPSIFFRSCHRGLDSAELEADASPKDRDMADHALVSMPLMAIAIVPSKFFSLSLGGLCI